MYYEGIIFVCDALPLNFKPCQVSWSSRTSIFMSTFMTTMMTMHIHDNVYDDVYDDDDDDDAYT